MNENDIHTRTLYNTCTYNVPGVDVGFAFTRSRYYKDSILEIRTSIDHDDNESQMQSTLKKVCIYVM
jgi:hypothetical protein